MSLRKDVHELLRLYETPSSRESVKPHLVPEDWQQREQDRLVFRSQVPDHLEPAFDIALGDELLELSWDPEGPDATVVITNKGRAAIAMHSTPGEVLSARLKVDLPGMTATLDDTVFDVSSEQALRWLRVLVEHPGDWISGKDLATHDPELIDVRTDRLKDKLPAEISALIDSETGKGSRIRLA